MKKKTKTVKKKTVKRPLQVVGRPLRRTKPPPKTLFAAIDPQGSLRFSSADEKSIDSFVGKLSKFYRVERYDLRVAKKEKRK